MCNTQGDTPIRLKRRPIAQSIENLDQLMNLEKGRMSRDLFWDRDIYEQELERIFARCWLFVGHESQIPKAGDYVSTYLGEDNVLIVRQKDGSVKGFLNTCPHRGNKVCFADLGNARQFVCNYHGWAFGIDGALKGMHASETYEAAGMDKSEHGLHPVAHVDSYRGLIFATLDPEAPSLAEYLGDMRYYLDAVFNMDEGGTEFIGGCVKSVIQCNWKYASENFVGDILHAGWTHDSGAKAMVGGPVAEVHKTPEQSYHVNFNGHGWEFNQDIVGNCATLGEKDLLKYLYVLQPKVAERLGELRSKMIGAISSCTLFPNTSFLPGQNTFRTWHPRGPGQIELHTWTFVNKSAPQEIKDKWRKGTMMTFSPSGVFEMDDGENWEYSTRSNAGFVTRQQDLYLGLGHDTRVEDTDLPGNVFQGQINEANQRAFYQRWLDLMKADSWKTVPQRDVPKMKEGCMNAKTALPEIGVDAETQRRVEQFLYREARLLDNERWDDWLALMAEDIHYWMPTMENRRRADKNGTYAVDRGALYNDNLLDLTRRVTRFKQPTAWAEDPATRHAHVVAGIEVYQGEAPGEFIVHSTFVNYRSRVEKDNDLLVGRREDVLRAEGDSFRLARRKIIITQSVLMAKNLNTFL